MPKVSIVVPVYNVAQYLNECVDSIVNQTLEDIEIICVNDGSTDNSLEILKEYAQKDPRVKIIDKKNSGYGDSMNKGFDAATGEYIGIVESDDYIVPNMFETLYNKAKENDVDFIKADFCRFYGEPDDRTFTHVRLDRDSNYYNRVINPQEDLTPFRFVMNTWSGIYKREFLNKYGIRHNTTPGASYQDNGFWFQTFALAKRIYFLDTPFYMLRRDNPNSSINSKGKVFLMKYEYDFIRNFIEKYPDLKPNLLGVYHYKRFHNYLFNYNRIDIKYKKEFLKVFVQDYREASKANEIDYTWFYPKELKTLKLILKNPNKFYRKTLNKLSLGEKIFSITNVGLHKNICILGVKIKIKNKRKELLNKIDVLLEKVNKMQKNQQQNEKLINILSNDLQQTKKNNEQLINVLNKSFDQVKKNNNELKKDLSQVKKNNNEVKKDFEYKICKYMPENKHIEYLKDWYFDRTGEVLHLDNPQTFNEKIQWMKLYDSTPLKTRLADKYLVRDWVKEKIGEKYLIPILGVWENFDDIDFDKLPNQFVLKANHGSGWNIIVKDKSAINKQELKKKINHWLNMDYSYCLGFEMHYHDIPRRIIVEEFLENNNEPLFEYKMFCARGEVFYIYVRTPSDKSYDITFFDKNWNKQDFSFKTIAPFDIERPQNLDEIISIASKLSEDFNFVRVDLYRLYNGELKFGEMTFTPGSGSNIYNPPCYNEKLGSMIKL